MPEIRKNADKNGIEITFDAKPEAEVIQWLKDHKFRWSSFLMVWWKKFDEATWKETHEHFGNQLPEETTEDQKPSTMKKTTLYYKINPRTLTDLLQLLIELIPYVHKASIFSAGLGEEYLIVTGNYAAMHPNVSVTDFDDIVRNHKNIKVKRLSAKPTPEKRWKGKWSTIQERITKIEKVLAEEKAEIESDQAFQEVNQEIADENKVGTVRLEFMKSPLLLGREIQISMPNGEKRKAQFAIVELDNIIASHNEENFHSEPLYPKNAAGNNINDRNYKDDQAAQKAVMDYARELEPERLITTSRTPSGTPIITTDGFVVSGNNRTMSLKLAAKNYPDNFTEYVKYLSEEIQAYGFDNALIIDRFTVTDFNAVTKQYIHPVLVRIDYDFKEYTTQELAKYNKDTKKAERPVDKAIKLSNILRENSRCAEIIAETTGNFETFSEFYANTLAQKKLAKTLVECNLLTEQELPAYFSETTFTEAGKEFIENLLASLVLSREALIAAEQPGVKAIRQKLITSLPVLMKNASLPEGSLTKNINDAVMLAQTIKASGSEFTDWIRQGDLYGTKHDRMTVYLNRLFETGKFKFKQAIEGYNDAILKNQGASLFGEKPSTDEIFNHWIKGNVDATEQRLIEASEKVSRDMLTPAELYPPEILSKADQDIEKLTASIPEDFKKHVDNYLQNVKIERFKHGVFDVFIYDDRTNQFPTSATKRNEIFINLSHLGDTLNALLFKEPNVYVKAYYAFLHELSHMGDSEDIIMPEQGWEKYYNSPQEVRAREAQNAWLKSVLEGKYEMTEDEYVEDQIKNHGRSGRHGDIIRKEYRELKQPDYGKVFLREQDGLKLYLVDGEALRKDHIEFVSGGHGYVYDYIPKDEVWIDDNQKDKPADMEATIAHELFEIKKMRDDGLSYDDAHELANAMEKEKRNNEPEPVKYQFLDDAAKSEFRKNIKILSFFISFSQIQALNEMLKGSDWRFAIDKARELVETIQKTPLSYEAEGTPTDQKIIHLHYFKGGSDWYIIERDLAAEGEDPLKHPQLQAFGYAILNGDQINAEWGYINIEDLKNANVELDFYWTPKPFSEVKKKWSGNDEAEDRDKKVYGYDFMFEPINEDGKQLIYELQRFDIAVRKDDLDVNTMTFWYKENQFYLFDNSGEFKIDDLTHHRYVNPIDFKDNEGQLKSYTQLAREIKHSLDERIAEIKTGEFGEKTGPVALPTIDYAGEKYFVDFKLQQLRNVRTAVPFDIAAIKDEELKAKLRSIRSEFGPNVYMKGLDDENKDEYIFRLWIEYAQKNPNQASFPNYVLFGKQKGLDEGVINELYAFNMKYNDVPLTKYKATSLRDLEEIKAIDEKDLDESRPAREAFVNKYIKEPKKAASIKITDYSNDFEINKAIEALLDRKWNDAPDKWSADELEFLKGYSGYGGLDEFGEIGKGSLFEFYTPEKVIEKMWGLAYKHGYKEGPIIEPSASIGLFFKREYVKSSVQKSGYEINKYSAKICKLLYTEVNVNNGLESMYFEQLFIKNNYTVRDKVKPMYELAIGNPPYGEAQGLYMGMGEKSYTHAKNYIDYFIFRGLDLVVPGGLLIYIIGTEVAAGGTPWLDAGPSKCKEMIQAKAKLVDAYRLPEGLFARTNVVCDIVIFKKR